MPPLSDLETRRTRYFDLAEKRYERQIAALYKESLSAIRSDMAAIYEKYAEDGILTKAEMTRYNRLASMEQKIYNDLAPAVRASVGTINRLKPNEYGEAFFRTAWAVDNSTGVALDWGPLDKKAIVANLDNPFYQTATERLTGTLRGEVRNAINTGLALGQSYPQMMKDLKKLVNLKNFETMRILRTELHSAQEAGIIASYDEARDQGIEGRTVWISTLYGNTRDTHQAMDGVAQRDDGYFHGAIGRARYPGDPDLPAGERINCRCDARFEVEGFEPQIRRSREDGLIPYQTYPEWVKDKKLFK
jgi:hypothetical protein